MSLAAKESPFRNTKNIALHHRKHQGALELISNLPLVMQNIVRSDSTTSAVGYNGGYTAVCNDDLNKASAEPYDSFRGSDVEANTVKDNCKLENLECNIPSGFRLRSTSAIEVLSKKRMPFPEYLSVVANSTNALLGVSIFATPWGFARSGLLGGTLITLFVASLSFETSRILLEAQRVLFLRTGEVKSYPEIAAFTLGPSFSTLVHTATAVSCLGGCVGTLIFLGELCGQLFGVSRITVTAAVTVPLILLSWVRSFRELTIFTAIGVIVLVISIFVILIDGLRETTGEIIENTPLFLPIGKTLSFIGPATFCYTIHYCVLAMGAEGLVCVKNEKILYSDQTKIKKGRQIVSEESKKLNPVSLHTKSSSLSDDNYDDKYDIFIVGDMNDEDETIKEEKNSDCGGDTQIMKSISKGNIDILNKNMNIDINMNMNMNVSVTDIQNEIINIHKTVSEIPLFPQINETLSESPKRKLQSVLTDISNPLGTAYLLTSILNITFGGVGYAFYRESEIIRDNEGLPQVGCEDRVCQNIILNLPGGAIKQVVGLTLCISIILGYVLILAPVRDNIETSLIRVLHFKAEESWRKSMFRNILRALLVLSTAGVAILAPYFGEVLGVVGGLTDALQAFVIPPIICLYMRYTGSMHLRLHRKIFYLFLFLWGLCIIGYTVEKLFHKILF